MTTYQPERFTVAHRGHTALIAERLDTAACDRYMIVTQSLRHNKTRYTSTRDRAIEIAYALIDTATSA